MERGERPHPAQERFCKFAVSGGILWGLTTGGGGWRAVESSGEQESWRAGGFKQIILRLCSFSPLSRHFSSPRWHYYLLQSGLQGNAEFNLARGAGGEGGVSLSSLVETSGVRSLPPTQPSRTVNSGHYKLQLSLRGQQGTKHGLLQRRRC